MMLTGLRDLKGFSIEAKDGEIGKVYDVYFDDYSWTVRYFVDKTGFWLFGRQVLISPAAVRETNVKKRQIQVDLNREQIERSPTVEQEKPLNRDIEKMIIQYYQWPTYLSGDESLNQPGNTQTKVPYPLLRDVKRDIVRDKEAEGTSLQSAEAVLGYAIATNDGDLGHVDDFVVDSQTWEIRYLVIQTGKHLKEKKVLIAPEWIDWISWRKHRVSVSMDQEKIKACPDFDLSLPVQREYEEQIYAHFECKRYWDMKTNQRSQSV